MLGLGVCVWHGAKNNWVSQTTCSFYMLCVLITSYSCVFPLFLVQRGAGLSKLIKISKFYWSGVNGLMSGYLKRVWALESFPF